MPKFIILNGPPGCGKDTIGSNLYHKLDKLYEHRVVTEKFSFPIKEAVASFLYLSDDEYEMYFESPATKDTPSDRFFGKTPREVLISFSEDWVKPQFGIHTFGELMVRRLKHLQDHTIIITDCGFEGELIPLRGYECVVVRLHRKGKTFEADSRGYILQPEGMLHFDLDNDNSPDYATFKLMQKLREIGFLKEQQQGVAV